MAVIKQQRAIGWVRFLLIRFPITKPLQLRKIANYRDHQGFEAFRGIHFAKPNTLTDPLPRADIKGLTGPEVRPAPSTCQARNFYFDPLRLLENSFHRLPD